MNNNLKLIQLTDMHLFTDATAALAGLNTNASLDAILAKLKAANYHQADAIVITGDLIQDYQVTSYAKLSAKLSAIKLPIYWLPGNHDIAEIYQGAFSGPQIKADKVIDFANWRLILLNSAQWGKVTGFISEEQQQFLTRSLQACNKDNIILALHHPPCKIKPGWLNNVGLLNSEDLWPIINTEPRVKCVLSGHVHQDFTATIAGVKVFTTPSTCIQFDSESNDFSLAQLQPGYRYLELFADGEIKTQVNRLENFELNLDLNTKGYS